MDGCYKADLTHHSLSTKMWVQEHGSLEPIRLWSSYTINICWMLNMTAWQQEANPTLFQHYHYVERGYENHEATLWGCLLEDLRWFILHAFLSGPSIPTHTLRSRSLANLFQSIPSMIPYPWNLQWQSWDINGVSFFWANVVKHWSLALSHLKFYGNPIPGNSREIRVAKLFLSSGWFYRSSPRKLVYSLVRGDYCCSLDQYSVEVSEKHAPDDMILPTFWHHHLAFCAYRGSRGYSNYQCSRNLNHGCETRGISQTRGKPYGRKFLLPSGKDLVLHFGLCNSSLIMAPEQALDLWISTLESSTFVFSARSSTCSITKSSSSVLMGGWALDIEYCT
jgi:hypothetical protein